MASINVILRKPPYGTVDASEAIRHALGGVTEDMSVNLFLVDGGVNAALKHQDVANTEYLSVEEGIKDCIEMGVNVYAERMSLRDEGIEAPELTDGIKVISGFEMAEIINSANVTMVF